MNRGQVDARPLEPTAAQRELLHALQHGLELLYRLDPSPAVTDFLLAPTHAVARGEQLWVVQGDDLQLGLALDPLALTALTVRQLAIDNLQQFCLVVEGVSHFLFLMHRARHDQCTSALELELQSEVDKYVAALMLARRHAELPSHRLRQRLYAHYRLLSDLSPDERDRYHSANRMAQRYARRLEQRFVRQRQVPAMLRELRLFYRMPCWAKHAHIHQD